MKAIKDIRENVATMTVDDLQKEIDARTNSIWNIKMSENYDSLKISTLKNELYEIQEIMKGKQNG